MLTHRTRGITRNPKLYPDAEDFNPARWLEPSFPTYREPLTQYPNLTGFSQFGFGRRTCQGIPIVEQDLFMTMGGMAWAFNIRKKRNPLNGEEKGVHWNDYTPLLIAKPTPFEFEAVPRSGVKLARMRKMYEGVLAESDSALDGSRNGSRSVSPDDFSYGDSCLSSSSYFADGSDALRSPKVGRQRRRTKPKDSHPKDKEVASEDENSEPELDDLSLARELQPSPIITNLTDMTGDNEYFGDVETASDDTLVHDSDGESVFDWGCVEKAPIEGDADLFSPITEEFPPYVDPGWMRPPEVDGQPGLGLKQHPVQEVF